MKKNLENGKKKLWYITVIIILAVFLLIVIGLIVFWFYSGKNDNDINNSDVGTISYDNIGYTCKVGETINAELIAVSNDQNVVVNSYASNDMGIASVVKHPELVAKCNNCEIVQINCLKEGATLLTATSSTGATTSVSVKVEASSDEGSKDKGTIKFSKTSYTCNVGETISTEIMALSDDINVKVSDYASKNISIATIEKHPELVAKCNNCEAVQINCLKEGMTTLTATSSTGATTVVTVNVKKANTNVEGEYKINKIYKKDMSGLTFAQVITKFFEDSNYVYSFNAPISKYVVVLYENGKEEPVEEALNAGRIKISDLDMYDIDYIKDAKDNAVIKFSKTSYSCNVGSSFFAMIELVDYTDRIDSYKSNDAGMLKIEKSSMQPSCPCVAINVTCLKEGTTKLVAVSRNGVSVEVPVTVNKSSELNNKVIE